MAIDLRDSIACVTGGGRGIGRATATALVARGAFVFVGDLDASLAERAASELGGRARGLALDVADADSFASFFAEAESAGVVDLLVNNAGIMRTGPFAEQDPRSQHREIAINLGGVVTGMRLALPGMLARNRGHIVNVASMAGKMTTPGAALYSASKFAVTSLSRAVRAEIAASEVTITTVLPAAVRTDLTDGLDTRFVPMFDPEDVAEAIVGSCDTDESEITLPRWARVAGLFEEVLPERVGEFVKRSLGAQDRLSIDNSKRRSYRDRT